MVYLPLLFVVVITVRIRSKRNDAVLLLLCAQAPMGLVPTWADLPSGNVALRGMLEQVGGDTTLLLGTIAVVTCALIPVALAWMHLHAAGRAIRIALVGVYVVAWVGVLIAFDGRMLFGGAMSCCGLWWFSTGAVLRAMVWISMLGLVRAKLPKD